MDYEDIFNDEEDHELPREGRRRSPFKSETDPGPEPQVVVRERKGKDVLDAAERELAFERIREEVAKRAQHEDGLSLSGVFDDKADEIRDAALVHLGQEIAQVSGRLDDLGELNSLLVDLRAGKGVPTRGTPPVTGEDLVVLETHKTKRTTLRRNGCAGAIALLVFFSFAMVILSVVLQVILSSYGIK